MGRSRGGLTTKIHASVDARGRPIGLSLSEGQAHDAPAADDLLATVRQGTIVLADRAYDSNKIRNRIIAHGGWANIPPKSSRKDPIRFNPQLYKERNRIERFFNKLKHFRRIATRYDKYAENYLAMIKLACCRIWMRSIESTS